jgi:hypothetical protein
MGVTIMKILNSATAAAHKAKLVNRTFQRYSQYPVHDSEFWESLFLAVKTSKGAKKILEEISIIENEPCIENERVWRNVSTLKSMAKMTVLRDH